MRDGVASRGMRRRSRRRKEVADTMETAEEDAPGDARDAAQFLSVGARNVESVAAKEEPEAMGGVLASRVNDNIN